MWPQYVIIAIWAMGFGINLVKHGEPKNDKYSIFWFSASLGISWFILSSGGFFKGL